MDIAALFAGMRHAPRHIKHAIDAAETATKPYANLGPIEGTGAGSRRHITIGFGETYGQRAFEGVCLNGNELSFTLVGGWELDEIGEVLRQLGDALTTTKH